jgi:3'-phosphoadenosine 5'-phosphosulfate sulfotransferase (PAPS reductase)/FAD synthetase
MASESRLRYSEWLQHGCNAFEKKRATSQPLSFWTEQDILHYIKKYNVPYCPIYGEIVVDDNDEGKWQPNKEGLGLAKVLDYIGVPYK